MSSSANDGAGSGRRARGSGAFDESPPAPKSNPDFEITVPFHIPGGFKGKGAAAAGPAGADPDPSRQRIRAWDDPILGVKWEMITPLIWAPAFPFIRHSLRAFPAMRTRIIFGCIVVANLHGFWLINNPDLSDEALGIKR